ncbi:MAG: tetratricopeptide repeat protein, partial [Bacteroidota bacterium]
VSESLMTETLARIYLEQKNYDKAIQSYKILSLKYPEKSSFFADQIKWVEEVKDNNTK